MSLQDLGNLGEFIGALGVVVTLIYLAAQIRQNTRAIRDSAEKEMAREASHFLSPIIENAEVARILRIGLQEWDKLDDDERMRFSMLLFRAFFHFQHLFSLHRERHLDPEFWASQWEVMLWYIRRPGFHRWWSTAKSRFNRSFVEYIESEAAPRSDENAGELNC